MSSSSIFKVTAHARHTCLKDGVWKGFWNGNQIEVGSVVVNVDKNIYENGGGCNTRCYVTVKNGEVTAESFPMYSTPSMSNDGKTLQQEVEDMALFLFNTCDIKPGNYPFDDAKEVIKKLQDQINGIK